VPAVTLTNVPGEGNQSKGAVHYRKKRAGRLQQSTRSSVQQKLFRRSAAFQSLFAFQGDVIASFDINLVAGNGHFGAINSVNFAFCSKGNTSTQGKYGSQQGNNDLFHSGLLY
jgi:hypothetical protein